MAVWTTISNFVLDQLWSYQDVNELKENVVYLKDTFDVEHDYTTGTHTAINANGNIQITKDGSQALLGLYTYRGSGVGNLMRCSRYRGSVATPTQIMNGDTIFAMGGRGYHDGGALSGDMCYFSMTATEDFTSTARGTAIDLKATEVGSQTLRNSVRIYGRQVGLNNTLPTAHLDIVIPTATMPGIYLKGASSQSADYLNVMNSASTVLLALDANGRLGINETSPSGMLSIVSNGTTIPCLILEAASSHTGNLFEINTNGGSGGDILKVDADPADFAGQVYIKATAVNHYCLDLDVPSSATAGQMLFKTNGTISGAFQGVDASTRFQLTDRNLGNNVAGPEIYIGRNNSAGTEGAAVGTLRFIQSTGASAFLWVDGSGVFRINTAAPTGSSGSPTVADTAGTVIGTQTSQASEKDILGPGISKEEALSAVLNTEVLRFKYKSKDGTDQTRRFGGEEFQGVVINDGSEWYAMDSGKSLNEINVTGYLVRSIQALNEKVEGLRRLMEVG